MASNEEVAAARRAVGEDIEEPRRGRWMPPVADPRDPFLQPAPTYRDETIRRAAEEQSTVSRPGVEPGPSEFSHGRGMVAPLGLKPPTDLEVLQEERRTNPADPEAAPVWTEDQNWSADGTRIARVREPDEFPTNT